MAQRYRVSPTFSDINLWVRESASAINAFFREISETSDDLTAGTTQTQAGATALSSGINRITTATNNDGVRLPFAEAGGECVIRNDGGAAVQVWPHSGGKVDGGATNAVDSNTLADGSARIYRAMSQTEWYTIGNS